MSLVPRDYWDSLFDFGRMFDNSLFPTIRHSFDAQSLSPRIDVIETNTNYEITADLPGVKKEDITLSLTGGNLSIEANTVENKEEKQDGKVIRKERYEGRFMRSFYLGNNVRQEDIDASFTDGVLKIKVPKIEPSEPETTKIEVK
ncbi:Hsp20/alpha crystallin family protein [Photobacterium sp. SDRW27]|uniref:Hsp20/alpha crystallin family protein n=1 Tax=Photobacterium obscurum TaxID=2829490 RepID=UPI0022430CAE|nr:Hsp20/alpha crystallin family protein [Photobacterium obscurum]MCW8329460.1 Hsp20/alpha crystallin family protein [Photobacterium obscurum]